MRIDPGWWSFIGAAACLVACGSRTPLAEPAGDGGAAAATGGDGGEPGATSPDGASPSANSAAATSSPSASAGSGAGGAAGPSGSGGEGGSEPTPVPQCLCPEEPGYAECVLPLMCCPCAGTCEDPETFNCSCEDPLSCIEPDASSPEP